MKVDYNLSKIDLFTDHVSKAKEIPSKINFVNWVTLPISFPIAW